MKISLFKSKGLNITLTIMLIISLTISGWPEIQEAHAVDTVVFLTEGTTYEIPGNWSDTNTIEVIGGGGAGYNDTGKTAGAGGGGGGAYSVATNVSGLSGIVTIQVGAGGPTSGASGTDTWFAGASCGVSSACAKGGTGATSVAEGAGGLDTGGVGTQSAGGAGGTGNTTGDTSGGGGGAAGPNGVGADGGDGAAANNWSGGSGGGHGGGYPGNTGDADGVVGGNNYLNTGGGTAGGGDGSAGGGGGSADKGGTGGAGGAGEEWDATHGSGGGGGGAGDNPLGTGSGGLYGGGGAGGGAQFGTGANGIIVITYTPTLATTSFYDAATNNSIATIAPGASATDTGRFDVQDSSGGGSTITSITVTFPANVVAGIASVQVWDSTETTGYLSETTPTGDTFVLTTGTAIPTTTSLVEFHILVTPKTHGNMPVPNGASYAATAYITAATCAITDGCGTFTDSTDSTVTIDNLSPTNAADGTASVTSDTSITLNWTTSSSSDATESIVLRWQAASTGAEVPVEGKTDYALDEAIGTATVACIETNAPSTAANGVDGGGAADGCSTTLLSSGTEYSYKHFDRDTNGNWDQGADNTNSPLTTTGGAPDPTYTLTEYIWYVDNDNENVTEIWGTPNILKNIAIPTLPSGYDPPGLNQELRLRVNMTVNTNNLLAGVQQFDLQYKVGTDGDCTTGSWTDVGAGGGGVIWRFATSGIADGENLTVAKLTDTTDVLQEYVKVNPSATNHNTANATEQIEYDFHIEHNSATPATQYSFRVREADDTILDAYTVCPTLTTEPETGNFMRHGNFFQNFIEQGFFW